MVEYKKDIVALKILKDNFPGDCQNCFKSLKTSVHCIARLQCQAHVNEYNSFVKFVNLTAGAG